MFAVLLQNHHARAYVRTLVTKQVCGTQQQIAQSALTQDLSAQLRMDAGCQERIAGNDSDQRTRFGAIHQRGARAS